MLKEPDVLLGQVILFVFIVVTSVQVVSRYVLGAPLEWPEELNAILLIWLTFVGAVALTRRNDHIRVDLVQELIGARYARALDVVFDSATVVFLGFLIVGGWDLVHELSFERTPALRLRISAVIAIVPISAAIMAVFYAISVVRNLLFLIRQARHGG